MSNNEYDPTSHEKWDRAKTLMLESLHKPDDKLRGCAHNQKCYYELLEVRDQVIDMVSKMRNPRPYVDERLQIPTLAEKSESPVNVEPPDTLISVAPIEAAVTVSTFIVPA